MNQRQFIHAYNKHFRPDFNPAFFNRSDDDLITALKNVIYSCERNDVFKIKVLSFEVIDSYDDVNHILWEYEESIINKNKIPENVPVIGKKPTLPSGNSRKKVNQFAYINLKDSDLKLIRVTYYIEVNEKKDGLVNDTITVYIAVPRIIDGIYFRLNGNVYSAIYQIVDASTYNNSASKNTKKQSVTLKSIFAAIRVYRYHSHLVDIHSKSIPITYFTINVFRKSLLLIKYFLAKFGFHGSMVFLGLWDIFIVKDITSIDTEDNYVFPVKEYYIVVPKIEYDNIQICQSYVYTVHYLLNHIPSYEYGDIFGSRIYIESIGVDFTAKDMTIIYNKGLNILSSLDFIYDNITKSDLQLSDDDKGDIFRVLRWMMYEFNSLRRKDNLDISTKKIRYAEYIASYYATKLFLGICRISDNGNRADLNIMRKALQIPPMYLINQITKCQLVNYKNCVNDIDSLIALKYTYKGISGIGERSNAISSAYRSIHPSHLGRVDIDSSSNSDPGVSGTIVPLAKLYNNHFSEYQESSDWMGRIKLIQDQYKAIKSRKNIYTLIKDINPEQQCNKDSEAVAQAVTEVAYNLLQFPLHALYNAEVECDGESISISDCFGM